MTLTVGQVFERFDISVRTLHHHDEVGLLRPSRRSRAGYRRYPGADLTRLQHVMVYRRSEHLLSQGAAVQARRDEMGDLVQAIDRALEGGNRDETD